MFEPELSRKQIHCIEESTYDIFGTFPPPAVIRRPILSRRPGNCAPLASPRYAPVAFVLNCITHAKASVVSIDLKCSSLQEEGSLLRCTAADWIKHCWCNTFIDNAIDRQVIYRWMITSDDASWFMTVAFSIPYRQSCIFCRESANIVWVEKHFLLKNDQVLN